MPGPSKGKAKTRDEVQKMEDELTKNTHFKKHEVKCLLQIFNKLCENQEEKALERGRFRDIIHHDFHMTDDILLDRIFRAFDKGNHNKVTEEEWVKGLSIFLKGTLKEKIKFCFEVYDLNSDGIITKEEMFHLLKYSMPQRQQEEDPDEGVKDLVEHAIKQLDKDLDMRVSQEDFTKAVTENNLLLECLGQCLPEGPVARDFMAYAEDPYQWEMKDDNAILSELSSRASVKSAKQDCRGGREQQKDSHK